MGKVYSMAIKYLDSRRIGALSTDYGAESSTISDDLTTNNGWVFPTNSSYDSTNDQIDLTIASSSFDVSYIDLQKAVYFGSGNNLNDDNFIIRARITKNNDLGNTSKGGSLLLQVSSALTDSSKSPNPQDAVGMRIDTDRSASNAFYVHSIVNGTFWSGESSGISYSWGTGDLYWEIIGDGTNVTGELFTGSDYSTGSLGKVTTSQQSPTGMRYLKFCGFNDPSRTATQFSLQDFKIWNGVSSIPAKPTNVQDNSILVEKDTANRYWLNSKTLNEDFSSDNWTDIGSNGVTGGHLQLDSYLNNTDNTTYRAITELSDTAFVMKFSFKPSYTGWSSGTWSHAVWFGLASASGNSAATQDWVTICVEGWSSGNRKVGGYVINGNTALTQMPGLGSGTVLDFVSGTTYYCKITRDGDVFTFNIYSDSVYSTQVATVTRTVSGITGLDTLVGSNWIVSASNDATFTCEIDDISIWNGTTTGATWTMEPTYPYSSTGWSATGGGAVATNNLTLAFDTDGGQDQVNFDLTSISSDKFVLDFTLNFSRLTVGSNIFWFMGLVNSTNWIATNSTNHMGIFVMQESGTQVFGCSDGTSTWNGASEDNQTWVPTTGVDYHFRLTKLTSTTYKVELFSNSNRNSVTSISSGTVSSMTDLRYLVFTADNNVGTGNATFTVSNLNFYNGVTSIN